MPAGIESRPNALLSCTACGTEWPPPATPLDGDAPGDCDAHSGHPAAAVCDRCDKAWCEPCLGPPASAARGPRTSPCCASALIPRAGVRHVEPYWRDPLAVAAYPWRRKGVLMLLLFWLGSFVPLLSWILLLLLAAYLQHILRRSAQDLDHLPDYPALQSVPETILYPLGRLLTGTLLAWGPLLLYVRHAGGSSTDPAYWLLAAVGVVAWPILAIVASLTPSVVALFDFPAMIRAVSRIGPDYAVTCVVLAGLGMIDVALTANADASPVAGLASTLFRVYASFVTFHVLGRLVLQTARRVDWAV